MLKHVMGLFSKLKLYFKINLLFRLLILILFIAICYYLNYLVMKYIVYFEHKNALIKNFFKN